MKFDKDHVDRLIKALEDGQGRVRAVKAAGIAYVTFLEWLEADKPCDWVKGKPKFSKLIKKAEFSGLDKIKDLQVRKIIENKSWQSAAWWLERNYPDEFRNKQEVEHSGDIVIKISKDEAEV